MAKPQAQMELNPRGIPRAPFVDNVEEYVGGKDAEIEGVIKKFQETSAKYRYMEVNLQQRRSALQAKIPDIEETLRVVSFLAARKARAEGKEEPAKETDDVGSDLGSDDIDALLDGDDEEEDKDKPLTSLFELNDTLYAEAQIQETGEVGLWLGANTMLLYPLDEASELLSTKLAAAQKNLGEVIEDLEWIREQVTVMEVNFARVHNWDVKRRRERKAAEEKSLMSDKGADDA